VLVQFKLSMLETAKIITEAVSKQKARKSFSAPPFISPEFDPFSKWAYDIFILNNHISMATISVPLSPKLQESLDALVTGGTGSSRADVMRRALERLAEEEAINAVLQAEREVAEGKILRGDLRTRVSETK
jgi:Arc/MetJ-type ribon-helix-helix transcriptional regulator